MKLKLEDKNGIERRNLSFHMQIRFFFPIGYSKKSKHYKLTYNICFYLFSTNIMPRNILKYILQQELMKGEEIHRKFKTALG